MITALSQKPSKGTTANKNQVHLYRGSTLTYVLREAIGGNARTSLLITCSPHAKQYFPTLNTLDFGERCKDIRRVVSIERFLSPEELQALVTKLEAAIVSRDTEIESLKKQLADVDKAEKTYATGTGTKPTPSYMRGRGSDGDKAKSDASEAAKEACRREGYRKGAAEAREAMELQIYELENQLQKKDEEKYAFEARMQWAEETVAAQQKGGLDGEVSKWMRRSRNAEESKAKLEEEKAALQAELEKAQQDRDAVERANGAVGESGSGGGSGKKGGLEKNLRREGTILGLEEELRMKTEEVDWAMNEITKLRREFSRLKDEMEEERSRHREEVDDKKILLEATERELNQAKATSSTHHAAASPCGTLDGAEESPEKLLQKQSRIEEMMRSLGMGLALPMENTAAFQDAQTLGLLNDAELAALED